VIGVKLPTGARGLAEVRNWFSARTGGSRVALGMLAAIVVLYLAGWITLIAVVVPQHLAMGPKVFGLGNWCYRLEGDRVERRHPECASVRG
jgi:hypothetical protein